MAESQRSSAETITSTTNPPIIMKVDAPDEDTAHLENESNEKKCTPEENHSHSTTEFKMCNPENRPLINNVNNNPFASRISRGILKPPQLSLNNSNSFSFNPSRLNAFTKNDVTTTTTTTEDSNKTPFVLNPSRLNPFVAENTTQESENFADKQTTSTVQINGETTPKFVPLIHSDSKASSASQNNTNAPNIPCTSLTTSNSFVFGQNLQERVLAESNNDEEPKPSTSFTNGTTEMLFSGAIKQDVKQSESSATNNKESKSLSESAREYEESRANKRKYEEVEVRTGEEEENNILSISCKMFAFDKAKGNWDERGRGTLRLNDFGEQDHLQSRLVFRTSGSLRVVLNTKVWAEMTVEQASEKSVRFTALDSNGEIKVFLVMGSIEDARHLYLQLQSRLEKEVMAQKRKKTESNGPEGDSKKSD